MFAVLPSPTTSRGRCCVRCRAAIYVSQLITSLCASNWPESQSSQHCFQTLPFIHIIDTLSNFHWPRWRLFGSLVSFASWLRQPICSSRWQLPAAMCGGSGSLKHRSAHSTFSTWYSATIKPLHALFSDASQLSMATVSRAAGCQFCICSVVARHGASARLAGCTQRYHGKAGACT